METLAVGAFTIVFSILIVMLALYFAWVTAVALFAAPFLIIRGLIITLITSSWRERE